MSFTQRFIQRAMVGYRIHTPFVKTQIRYMPQDHLPYMQQCMIEKLSETRAHSLRISPKTDNSWAMELLLAQKNPSAGRDIWKSDLTDCSSILKSANPNWRLEITDTDGVCHLIADTV